MKLAKISMAMTIMMAGGLATLAAPVQAGTVLGGATVTNGARGVIDGRVRSHFNEGAVRLQFRVNKNRQADFMVANINLPAGVGGIDWHTHPGPTFGIVTGGGTLTVIDDDCVAHDYETGQSFVAPENPHTARNYSDQPVTVRATFIMSHAHPATMPTTFVSAEVDDVLDAYCGLED